MESLFLSAMRNSEKENLEPLAAIYAPARCLPKNEANAKENGAKRKI